MRLPDHTLYYKGTCPYCLKVLEFMDRHDIRMDMADAWDPKNYGDLVRIGGMGQVPCLVIEDTALYESEDIIAYLAKKLQGAQPDA